MYISNKPKVNNAIIVPTNKLNAIVLAYKNNIFYQIYKFIVHNYYHTILQ